ncbi:MAG TPA: NUDIX hydrolase [Glycomyces sp.]|nr:NUDIX hydrolase [Glycomyces sp.]
MTDDAANKLARLLDSLAEHADGAVSPVEIGRRAGLDDAEAAAAVPMLMALLDVFGAMTSGDAADHSGVPVSVHARNFLRSLGEYARADRSVLHNWERSGADDTPNGPGRMLRGLQFLYLIEQQRATLDSNAGALRQAKIVQVVVKARPAWGTGKTRYLTLYDPKARQYQLPGGHVRESDPDNASAAIREIEEEIAGFVFDPETDSLKSIGTIRTDDLSRTYSVLTEYEIEFFLLSTVDGKLPEVRNGCWVSERDLLKQRERDGEPMNVKGLQILDQQLAGGIASLPGSMGMSGPAALRTLVRDRRWELLGLLIGIAGLTLSLLPLLR